MKTNDISIEFPDGRVIPGQLIVGVSEITDFMKGNGTKVPRKTVSTWMSPRDQNGRPDPLPLGPGGKLARGTVWDLRDIARWKGFPVPDDPKGPFRVIGAHRVIGVAEAKTLLDNSGRFVQYPEGIPRGRISTWGNRFRTTEFPVALRIGPGGSLSSGSLWDAVEVALWQGPPGRWSQRDPNEGLVDGRASY